ATDVAATALETGRPVADLVLERGLLDEARLASLLSPASMTAPHRTTPTGALPAVSEEQMDSGEITRLPEEQTTEGCTGPPGPTPYARRPTQDRLIPSHIAPRDGSESDDPRRAGPRRPGLRREADGRGRGTEPQLTRRPPPSCRA